MTKYGPYNSIKTANQQLSLSPLPVLPTTQAGAVTRCITSRWLWLSSAITMSHQRYFADIKCITRFPEFGHEFKHNSPCDMPPGQANGQAVVDSYAIALNFKDPHNTVMEVEFNMGAGALAEATVPIKYPALAPA